MRVSPDATIIILVKWPCSLDVDDSSEGFLFERAVDRLSIPHDRRASSKVWKIVRKPSVRKFGHLDVLGALLESRQIAATRTDLVPVVRDTVEDPYRLVADLGVVDVSRDAGRIKRDVGGGFDSAWVPHLLKPFQARIKYGFPTARESHHSDAVWIDTRMGSKHREASIEVEDRIQATKL